MGEEPLGEIIKKVVAKEANCGEYVKSATGWACVEALAVYCVGDDTIYYNVNRTQQYVEGLFRPNAATLL